jgi:hypothetical protein
MVAATSYFFGEHSERHDFDLHGFGTSLRRKLRED